MKLNKKHWHFLYESILPDYLVYSKKDKYAFCTFCQLKVDVDFKSLRPSAFINCPSCNRKLILKPQGRMKNGFQDTGCGIFYDKEDDCVVVRHYDVIKAYNNKGRVTFDFKEALREYFNKNGWVKGEDNTWEHGWKKLNLRRWSNMKGAAGQLCYHISCNWAYRNTYIDNIDEVLKGTPWEYSCLKEIYKLGDTHHYWDVPRSFLLGYLKSPVVEYLYKVGFTNLCKYQMFIGNVPMDAHQKTLPSILCVDKDNWKALLKNGNPDVEELKKRQIMSQYKFDEESYVIFEKHFYNSYYYKPKGKTTWDYIKEKFPKSIIKYDQYVESYAMRHSTSSDYRDYLDMCHTLGYDMNNSFILFPKDFDKAHNEVIQKWREHNERKAIEEAKKRNSEYEELRKKYESLYDFEENDLKIVVPKGCDEICKEGQNLHHCVGTYVDRVCKGLSIILFVRQMSNLEQSFYTMELQNDVMIQCRGFGNKEVTDEVRNFIHDFADKKNLTMRCIA